MYRARHSQLEMIFTHMDAALAFSVSNVEFGLPDNNTNRVDFEITTQYPNTQSQIRTGTSWSASSSRTAWPLRRRRGTATTNRRRRRPHCPTPDGRSGWWPWPASSCRLSTLVLVNGVGGRGKPHVHICGHIHTHAEHAHDRD